MIYCLKCIIYENGERAIIMILGEQAWNKNSSWQIVSVSFSIRTAPPAPSTLLHAHMGSQYRGHMLLSTEPLLTSPIGSSALSVAARLFSVSFPSSFVVRGLYSSLQGHDVQQEQWSLENGLLCVWSHNCGSVKGARDPERILDFSLILRKGSYQYQSFL